MTANTFTERTPEEVLASVSKPGCLLIDVRTPAEYQSEHVQGSVNIPLDRFAAALATLSKSDQVIFVCRTGKRASQAAAKASENGFQARVLKGGLAAWQEQGLALKQGRQVLPLDRQVQLAIGLLVVVGSLLAWKIGAIFLLITGFIGCGLIFAGLTGTCGLAVVLSKAPWNKVSAGDTQSACGKGERSASSED